jgi:hypothetical protein
VDDLVKLLADHALVFPRELIRLLDFFIGSLSKVQAILDCG